MISLLIYANYVELKYFLGALAMPRWASVSSLNSSSSSRSGRDVAQSALEPSLLTTCVGSMSELIDLISKIAQAGRCPIPLTTRALHALFYYMRCSQVWDLSRDLNKNVVLIFQQIIIITKLYNIRWIIFLNYFKLYFVSLT